MRVLHVGYGFRPWIVNGLVIYSEAVMTGQARLGHDVGYFCAARQLPLVRRPFVHRWRRDGVQMFELVNSEVIVGRHRGTPAPEDDLEHATSEAAFARVMAQFAPDLVHVHDLGGLPSSILELARAHGARTVMTIHDFHTLCPTVKLYDADNRVCLRHRPGEMCVVCCDGAPTDNREEVGRTLAHLRMQARRAAPAVDDLLRRAQSAGPGAAATRLIERRTSAPSGGSSHAHASADAYDRRRERNVERLSALDALIASSQRSVEIYRELGVAPARVALIAVNPPHIERLRPRDGGPGDPLRFVALNAANSTQKGADLIADALADLHRRGLDERFRLDVHGWVAPHVQRALQAHPSVTLHGDYRVEDLDQLLDSGDVGLLPSVWEEVYGFAGLEFLAKGMPVIANAIGAIPEYVRPGQTGWLNRTSSAAELADLMAHAIEDHDEVRHLRSAVVAARAELIVPFEEGLAAISALYEELVGR